MVNTAQRERPLDLVPSLVRVYLVVVGATLAALAVLSVTAPRLAPQEAWVHAVIVTVFAVLLAARARSAARGGARALRAVGWISAVLLVANVVEAVVPGLFPVWMRVEMIGIAVLMGAVVLAVVRHRAR